MASRLLYLPGAGGRGVMEPLAIEWVAAGWRTMPSGLVLETHNRKALTVDPLGNWTLSIKPQGKGIWRDLRGGPETLAIEFFRDMAEVQFDERDRATG